MDRKNLLIGGLAMSALMMACTLIIVLSNQSARAEVSVISSRESAVLTAASVKSGNSEVLVLIDRSTHIMGVFSLRGTVLDKHLDGSPVNLAKEFNPPMPTTTPKSKK